MTNVKNPEGDQLHRCVGSTWADLCHIRKIGVGGGRHEVGGGRHIETLALGEIFVGKMDKHIRAEDLRKRRNTIGGAGH